MHCSTSIERLRLRKSALAWVGVCMALLNAEPCPATTPDSSAGFTINHATTRVVDGVYVLDAEIEFTFSDEALDAMENGVPLTIQVDMEVIKVRRFWFDKRIARVEARYQVQTHALTKSYVVRNLGSGETRTYASFDEMLLGLGTITDFPMLDEHLLDAGGRYELRLRAHLDIEALPAPMRPLAYLSSFRELKSDWYEWPIEP